MPSKKAVTIVILLAGLALSAALPRTARADPGIIYVKADATGANNGTSWADAYTDLQAALAAANSGDEIWVAAGTYKPTTGTDRTASFQLKSGVALYGGFAGGESARDERDWEINVTILSGDLNGDDGPDFTNYSDNSYHVVNGSGTDTTAVLDGFTVTGGSANGYPYPAPVFGGGMFNNNSNLTLANCIFSDNYAISSGGGMYNSGSNPTVTDVTFSNNSSHFMGGGMFNSGSSPTLVNCTFSDNSAYDGGGMGNLWESSTPTLVNCTFNGNSARYDGGGMYNSSSNPMLTNCTFTGNDSAGWRGGGGMHNTIYSSPTLTNVTFSGNSAYHGGGIANRFYSAPELVNCTFSGNSADWYGGGMYNEEDSNPTLRNTIVANSTAGGDCYGPLTSEGYNLDSDGTCGFTAEGDLSNTDPLLGPLQNNGGPTLTHALLAGSPAIDAIPEEAGGGGYNGAPTTDQRGVSRPQPPGGNCDIGAYELERGTIIIEKQTNPPGGTGFGFTHDIGGGGSFNLDDGGPPKTFNDVLPGQYTVIEDDPTPAFDLTAIACDDGSSAIPSIWYVVTRMATINLDPGETVTCTFTNTQRGHIIVDKVTNPSGAPQGFDFTLIGGPSNLNQSFSLTDTTTPHDSGPILSGSGYNAAETAPTGWGLTSATCSDGSQVNNINVSPGETVTCTFTNTKRFTLTVNKAGTGAGTVISDPAGISCGEDCTENYDIDTIITLEARPGDDSFFVGWSGDCSGTELITTVTMDADKTCTATFNLKPPPVPVGGYAVLVNRMELLAPWLVPMAVASIAALMAALWMYGGKRA